MVVYGGKNKHLLRQTGKIESRLKLNKLPPPLERLRFYRLATLTGNSSFALKS